LVCTAEPNEVYWLRVFGSINFSSLNTNWQHLFQYFLSQVNDQQPQPVIASIAYLNWMRDLLDDLDWKRHQYVVQLKWKGVDLGKLARDWPRELVIRPMHQSDLEVVSRIDRDCFKNIWLQSKDVISRAYTQSSYTTVAEIDNEVIGFQISSSHNAIAHLIRLAVSPKFQGQYIGQALVHHMLKHFQRPWIKEITVNTQQDNSISLNLYDKMGFEPTAEKFPIYIYKK
jgi:ribosomal-protein-alanine N-acetyltransferase